MRRTELEKRLAALGWAPTGELSSMRHAIWRRIRDRRTIFVPAEDLVINAVVEGVLDEAER